MKCKFYMKIKLCKDVCEQCYKNKGWVWSMGDEIMWRDNKKVWCIMTQWFVEVDDADSLRCPYKFEHAIMAEKD